MFGVFGVGKMIFVVFFVVVLGFVLFLKDFIKEMLID